MNFFGRKREKMVKCKVCGRMTEDNRQFCKFCGSLIEPSEKNGKTRKRFVIVAFVIAAALLVVATVIFILYTK